MKFGKCVQCVGRDKQKMLKELRNPTILIRVTSRT